MFRQTNSVSSRKYNLFFSWCKLVLFSIFGDRQLLREPFSILLARKGLLCPSNNSMSYMNETENSMSYNQILSCLDIWLAALSYLCLIIWASIIGLQDFKEVGLNYKHYTLAKLNYYQKLIHFQQLCLHSQSRWWCKLFTAATAEKKLKQSEDFILCVRNGMKNKSMQDYGNVSSSLSHCNLG